MEEMATYTAARDKFIDGANVKGYVVETIDITRAHAFKFDDRLGGFVRYEFGGVPVPAIESVTFRFWAHCRRKNDPGHTCYRTVNETANVLAVALERALLALDSPC